MNGYKIELINKYWRLTAANGEIVCHSEQYATRWNAKRAASKLALTTGLPLYGAEGR